MSHAKVASGVEINRRNITRRNSMEENKNVNATPEVKEVEVKYDMDHHVSNSKLLEAGAHFGHQTSRWNPKMKQYIHAVRKDTHIIDLEQTQAKIDEAYAFLRKKSERGTVLFVGTKRQAQDAIKEQAERVGAFYINSRWLGGTLTNFRTVRKSVNRLFEIEEMEKNGTFNQLPKKEVLQLKKEQARLDNFFGGIKKMTRMPSVVVVLDPIGDGIAIKEANKLNIPVIALADTNIDPDGIDFIIPGNDDAIRTLNLMATAMANAVAEAKGMPIIPLNQEIPKPERPAGQRDNRRPYNRDGRKPFNNDGRKPYNKDGRKPFVKRENKEAK